MRLGLEIFLGMIVVSLAHFDHPIAYLLFIPLVLWWFYLHEYQEVSVIIFFVFIFAVYLSFFQPGFNTKQQGEITYINASGFQVNHVFYQTKDNLYEIGDWVEVDGELSDFPIIRNDGEFDQKHFLFGKGVQYYANAKHVSYLHHRWHMSQWAKTLIEKRVSPELKDIYQYLLLGIKADDLSDLTVMAKELAILHLFAISGMHFNILSQMLIRFLTFFVSEKMAKKVSLFLMGIYALILRNNVAGWRAYLSMLFKTVTPLSPWQCFGVVGCVLLWWCPGLVYNLGFIYSMSIYFLVILCANLKMSSIFVYIGSMAIGTYFQFEIYPLGYLAGLFFSVVISFLFPLFLLDVVLNGALTFINLLLYHGLFQAMTFCCDYSMTIVTGRPPIWLLIGFYLSFVWAIYRLFFEHQKKAFLFPICLGFLIIFRPYLRAYGIVEMVDVGQGDCFLISLPYQRANLLIDTGGLSYQDVAQKRLIPLLKAQGISSLDTVYISHEDFDHCGALESLKENFPVLSVKKDFDEDTYGEIVFKQLNHYPTQDGNDSSLVIDVTLGLTRFLFTGDISQEVETWLIDTYPNLRADVLKISHHGSSTSSNPQFLEHLKGKVALVSVGLYNRYHHPSNQVIANLEAYGYEIRRTDLEGAIKIYFTDHHTWIQKKKN